MLWLGIVTALVFNNRGVNSFVFCSSHHHSNCVPTEKTTCSTGHHPLKATESNRSTSSSPSGIMKDGNEISLIRNFRKAAGLHRIYRCANTDPLGTLFDASAYNDEQLDCNSLDETSGEHIVLNSAGLILDLRSKSERSETLAQTWMSRAPSGKVSTKYFVRDGAKAEEPTFEKSTRSVFRIDVLSPKRLFDYLSDKWITNPVQKAQYTFSLAFDTQRLHEMRMDILNEKGLGGLYESIVETSGKELFASLRAITEYLENDPEGDVIVHCVQGKDRTGLVIMLCQSVLGLDDTTIVADYHKSEVLLNGNSKTDGSAAAHIATASKTETKGKLNKGFFSGSPEEVMVGTLSWIRERHGSVLGYLDHIGFDATWRKRFLAVMNGGGYNMNETTGSGSMNSRL